MELQTASPLDERRALARTAFDELGQAIGGGATLHRAIAGRVFGGVERGTSAVAAPARAEVA